MYATVRHYETTSSSVPELLRRVNKDFLPLLLKMNGFVSYDILDTGRGVVFSITVFQSEVGLSEVNRFARKFAKDWSDILPNPPQVTSGIVVLHEGT